MINIRRDIADHIHKMANLYPIVALLGPTQSGKTTLSKALFPDKLYISLENLDERRFASEDPRAFFARLPQGAILDEIQRLPELLTYLQEIVDNTDTKGLFILTGSHQLALHESISQSLAGRTAILKLLPFSINELKNESIDFTLDEYVLNGMYPRIYKNNMSPAIFYRDYIATYVERDVRQMINIKDLTLFQQFLKLCAGRIGQVFNGHSLSNELGISYHTVSSWLSILEASFLIFRIQPYFENFGKRLIKSPKIYFTDTGLASYLLDIHTTEQMARDPLRGSLVENFIVSEFIKTQLNKGLSPSLYFYRDSNQNEIDLICKTGQYLIPVEIKSSQTYHSQFLKTLYYFKKLVKERCPKGVLIYSGRQEQKIQEFNVYNYQHVQTAYEWMNQIE